MTDSSSPSVQDSAKTAEDLGIDREVGATPLVNSKNHRPASNLRAHETAVLVWNRFFSGEIWKSDGCCYWATAPSPADHNWRKDWAQEQSFPVSPSLSTSSPELTKLLDDFTTAIHVYNESKTDRGPRALVEGAFKLQAIVAARSAIELSFATLPKEIAERLRKIHAAGRFNIDEESDGTVRICRGFHDSHADCEWQDYVPASTALTPEEASYLEDDVHLSHQFVCGFWHDEACNCLLGTISDKLRSLSGETPK